MYNQSDIDIIRGVLITNKTVTTTYKEMIEDAHIYYENNYCDLVEDDMIIVRQIGLIDYFRGNPKYTDLTDIEILQKYDEMNTKYEDEMND